MSTKQQHTKQDLFWLKSDLPWSLVKTVGAFIHGVMRTHYSPKATFYVIFPDSGMARKCVFQPGSTSDKVTPLQDISLGYDPDLISDFIRKTRAPCFILCNGDAAYEILTRGRFKGSVSIYLTGNPDNLVKIPADRDKVKPGRLPKMIMGARLMWITSESETESGE